MQNHLLKNGQTTMAKKFKDFVGHEATFHKTSIGRTPSKCKMNKSKRRSWKKYRGQGK